MVIINTSAVEVSIQAVSPELILSTPMSCGSVGAGAASGAAAGAAVACSWGAADAAAPGASSAHAAGIENVNKLKRTSRDSVVFNANPPLVLNCTGTALTGANANDLREVGDEYFPVAHFAGLGRLDECLDYLVGQGVLDGNFDFGFGYELDGVFGTAVDFGMPALPPKATDFSYGDTMHADVMHRCTDIVQPEWFDNCGN